MVSDDALSPGLDEGLPASRPAFSAAAAARLDGPTFAGLTLRAEARVTLVLAASGIVTAVTEAWGLGSVADPTALVGGHIAELCADGRHGPERRAAWLARIDVALESPAPVRYVDHYPVVAGRSGVLETSVTPVPGIAGATEAIVVQLHDQTVGRAVDARLRQSEAYFRLLAEALPQMVWVASAEGKVTYFSPRWTEFTGRSTEELLGQGYIDLMHPEDQAKIAETLATLEEQPIRVYSFRMRRHDGEWRWMEAHVHTIVDEHGTRMEVVGGTTDVTEVRLTEQARLVSQKREAIGTLAGGIAHDFNNVISAIVSNAWVAEAEVAAGESPATSLGEISRGAHRAGDLVRRLLAFAREEEPRRVPFDLVEVAAEACALVGPTLPAGVKVRRTASPGLPLALGDTSQLHQVVLNLVSNAGHALGAAGGAGAIDVSIDLLGAGRHVGRPIGVGDGPLLRLRVRDDGPGIPPDVLPRVFDPFFTTKPAGEGTGLGLAAAQTIIASHGGAIGVDSYPGLGTTFTVHLPAGPPERRRTIGAVGGSTALAAQSARTPTPPETPEPATRILFVDDEVALARLAPRALAASGCEAVAFTDPREALAAIRAAPGQFDALVTDLSMPEMSGLELIVAVLAVRPGLPVVLSSGFLTEVQAGEARALGVGRIVPKPCSLADLAAAVAELRATAAV